jgi:signal transduction histidine kinase
VQDNPVAASHKTKRQLLEEIGELHRRIGELEAGRDVAAQKQTEQALRHLLEASDHQRQLIAYEIHDGLAQQLAAALMQLQSCEHVGEVLSPKVRTGFDAALEMLRQAHAEARRLISGVRPPVLDESGLIAAIVNLVQDRRTSGGARVEFHSDVAFNRLSPLVENTLYHVAQEALSNACKHSRSERIRVMLVQEGDEVRLEVRDWGVGFDPATVAEGHFGLEGILARTRLALGKLTIESRPGHGTTVLAVVPLVERG